MLPAVRSNGHALVMIGMLLLFLTLPLSLHRIGGVSKEEAYRGISERAGAFGAIRRQIFDDASPVDIAFCGSSLMKTAFLPHYVEGELERATGRKASVLSLTHSWQGPDLTYVLARDLLEHRQVRMLVVASPTRLQRSDRPHVQLFRVARYGDNPGAFDGLSLRLRLSIYADFVLGAPRQALNLVRTNPVDALDPAQLAWQGDRIGYEGREFVRHEVNAPAPEPTSIVYSDATRERFRFADPALNDLQWHFIRKTVEMARAHGALVVFVHTPSPSERGLQVVPERTPLNTLLGNGVFMVGVPTSLLFATVPPDAFQDYFQDEHVNLNGTELFTKTVTPTLITLYERYATAG